MSRERWKPIAGYEGLYEVSSFGRIRSIRWRHRWFDRPRNFIKATPLNKAGYPTVVLADMESKRTYAVHRLVIIAFRGPPPSPNHECAHRDGNQANPRLDNLRWLTVLNNNREKNKHGTMARGERQGLARLNKESVLAIRKSPKSERDLAALYGISNSTVHDIRSRRTWKHL